MNMKRVIVKGPDFCAVTEDGILVEYIPVCTGAQSGVILLGRVNRLMPGMKCAFVDIGKNRSGFLPLDEESKSFTGGKVRSGEKMILQIKKEEKAGKEWTEQYLPGAFDEAKDLIDKAKQRKHL